MRHSRPVQSLMLSKPAWCPLLWLSETASLICNLNLSAAACTLVSADLSMTQALKIAVEVCIQPTKTSSSAFQWEKTLDLDVERMKWTVVSSCSWEPHGFSCSTVSWGHNWLLASLSRGWLVACLTSQQQASVSQGRICTDNFTCCHTEIEVADPTFYLTQSQYTDTGPTSPSADPITPGAWQGSHWSANF